MKTINTYQKNKEGELIPSKVSCEMSEGLGVHVVGIPDISIKESLLRVVTALFSLGYTIPGKKITINITPVVKDTEAENLDLPIALAILAEEGKINVPENIRFTGRLNLNATIVEGTSTSEYGFLKKLIKKY